MNSTVVFYIYAHICHNNKEKGDLMRSLMFDQPFVPRVNSTGFWCFFLFILYKLLFFSDDIAFVVIRNTGYSFIFLKYLGDGAGVIQHLQS